MKCLPLFIPLIFGVTLGGCAEVILSNEEAKYPGALDPETATGRTADLRTVASEARNLADAYLDAGRRAMRAQDIGAAGLFVATGSLISGAVGSASDTALANRALAAVGAQTITARGTPKSKIEAILDGAAQLNCVATVATVFSAGDSSVGVSPLAVELTRGLIREIRIATRHKMVDDAVTVANILDAYGAAIGGVQGISPAAALELRADAIPPTQQDLEAYLVRLEGCLREEEPEEEGG